jgi:hypothetical protein
MHSTLACLVVTNTAAGLQATLQRVLWIDLASYGGGGDATEPT